MLQVIEEISESQSPYQNQMEEIHHRIWEEVAQQYRVQIEQLQEQLWQNDLQKLFSESNGVPKKYLDKIKTMVMRKSSKECSICCDSFGQGEMIMQLPCKHIFHLNCAKPWLKHSRHCPNCREDVVEKMKKV